MTTDHDSTGIEWVVATVAPWAVSPHPNFSNPRPTAAETLALVTENRFQHERARYDFMRGEDDAWKWELVEAAAASLDEPGLRSPRPATSTEAVRCLEVPGRSARDGARTGVDA